MRLSEIELGLIEQTLAVPLMAFGKETLVKKTSEKKVEELEKVFFEIKKTKEIQEKDLPLVIIALLYARDIIDHIEYPTLTGYDWDQSTGVIVNLISKLQKNAEG